MTPSEEREWAVVLSKPEFLDWPRLGKALASFRKIPMQDAAHDAKNSWGIVAENLDEKGASELSRCLDQSGLGGVVVPKAKLAQIRPANLLNQIALNMEGLQVEAKLGAHRVIPWSFFSVAAVSVFKKTMIKTIKVEEGPSAAEKLAKTGIMLATGIPIPMKKKKTVERKIEDPDLFFFCDLFLKQNSLRIRLDAQTLDYSFLGERKGFGAHGNFRLLVNEIGSNAKGALVNRGMRVLLNSQPINTAGYEDASDFEKECRWLLTLANLKE